MSEAASALEQIRRTEMAAARKVEEARVRATEIAAEAEREARRIVDDGKQRGMEAARLRYQEGVDDAEAEAAAIRAAGIADADQLVTLGKERVEALVEEMVEVVLAPPLERGK